MVKRIHAAVLLNLHSQVAYAVLSAPLSLCTKKAMLQSLPTHAIDDYESQRALANVNRRSCPHALIMLIVISKKKPACVKCLCVHSSCCALSLLTTAVAALVVDMLLRFPDLK